MEQGKNFSAKTRKPHLKSSIKENESRSSERKKTFRTAARQVWIANSLSKRSVEPYLKANEDCQKMPSNKLSEAFPSSPSRPQSLKRKGTPEIFPMSSEMRKTLVLLGNLDLLPEEERQKEVPLTTNPKKISSFRQRTQMRVIQPQRFIRSFRKGGIKNGEKIPGGSENNSTTAESLINSRERTNTTSTLCSGGAEVETIDQETMKLETLSVKDEEGGRKQKDAPRFLKSSSLDLSTRDTKRTNTNINSWRKAIKKHQHGQVVPNPSNPFFIKRRFSPTKRNHLSKSWQSSTNVPERLPSMRRALSLSTPRSLSSDAIDLNVEMTNYTYQLKDGKTVDEIANDIQERCSKWFEFRQKILMKSYEYK